MGNVHNIQFYVFKNIYFYLYVYLCVSICICAMCVLGLLEARRGHQIPWSGVTGCYEMTEVGAGPTMGTNKLQSLHEHCVLLTMGPSLKFLLLFARLALKSQFPVSQVLAGLTVDMFPYNHLFVLNVSIKDQ